MSWLAYDVKNKRAFAKWIHLAVLDSTRGIPAPNIGGASFTTRKLRDKSEFEPCSAFR